jgi:hypothetical protein
MDNLSIYNKVRSVPPEAQKKIGGGRLSGMTDINPMWRLKSLTEQFGICGIGWKYEITDKRLEKGAKEEIAAFVDINLYIKVDGEWSAAIPGTGGSSFVANESKGLYTSDECFKMALTDAISVACKALGFGADVYWDKDRTKYTGNENNQSEGHTEGHSNDIISKPQANRIFALSGGNADICKTVLKTFGYEKSTEVQKKHYDEICKAVQELAADNL